MSRKKLIEDFKDSITPFSLGTEYSVPSLLTGSTLLDLVLGGGKNKYGLVPGNIYNIIGDSSAGKTFIANEIIAVNRNKLKDNFKWNYDDCEDGCTIDSNTLYGFDIIDEDTLRSDTVEKLFINVSKFIDTIKQGEYGIYVVDSLDALTSKATLERGDERIKADEKGKEFKEGSYMMDKQKYLSGEFFPLISDKLKNSNCTLIIISQVRDNIGVMFGEKFTVSGGKALQFYSHSRLMLNVVEKLEVKNRIISIRVKAKTKKSKTERPFRECYVNIVFDYGIDDVSANIEYLYNTLTDLGKDKGKTQIVFDEDNTFPSVEKAVEYIEQNDMKDILKNRVIHKWEAIEDSIKSVRSKKYD